MSTTPAVHDATRRSAGWSSTLVMAAAAVLSALRRRHRRQVAIRRLHALDDRMLNDIGISRTEIESAVTFGTADRSRRERGYGKFGAGMWG